MQSRCHQQGPHKNLGWILFQVLNNTIIFWLHLSLEFLRFAFAYRSFTLTILLSSKRQLFRSITPSRTGHTLSGSSFNHKFWPDKIFWWHQGNNFRGCQDNELFFFYTQKGHKSFQLVTIDWSYHFYDAPIIICFNHINIVASMIRQRVDVDISRSWLKIDYLFVD